MGERDVYIENQSKLVSLLETITNTVIGFLVGLGAWPIIAWVLGMEFTSTQHWGIVALFTVLSIIRGYLVRRFFNARLHIMIVGMVNKLTHLGIVRFKNYK
jgi:hypothetical protein|tara:strand:+ start:9270 stop:9572 length:303 start_codon:yes stop_codon:yes gene_type:complete